jgi:hypothetical protein
LITYNKQHHHHCWRERPWPVPRWEWQWQQKLCQQKFCWSTRGPEENPFYWGYDSRLCLFSHYQIHPTSINKTNGAPSAKDGVTADVKSSTNSWNPQIASIFFSKSRFFGRNNLRHRPMDLPHHFYSPSDNNRNSHNFDWNKVQP